MTDNAETERIIAALGPAKTAELLDYLGSVVAP